MMTFQEKMLSLNGKKVTIRDWFANHLITETGIAKVLPTEWEPGCAYISIEGKMGAYLADYSTIIWELKDKIIISIGRRPNANA